MKRISIAMLVILLMLATAVCAAEKKPVAKEESAAEIAASCARATMFARQNGVPIEKMMAVCDEHFRGKKAYPIMRRMIIEAYRTPRYSDEAYRQRAIDEFANEWYLRCCQ